MGINFGSTAFSNFKIGDTQIAKICKGEEILWENWVEKTGEIGVRSCSANNGWNSSGVLDLGKQIIPLEGKIYFSWSMSNGQYSTSCGASMSGGLTTDSMHTIFSHSRGDFGKNGSGSSTETKTVGTSSQVPIRYVSCSCGGGTGGGSTSYSMSARITRWLEKGNS